MIIITEWKDVCACFVCVPLYLGSCECITCLENWLLCVSCCVNIKQEGQACSHVLNQTPNSPHWIKYILLSYILVRGNCKLMLDYYNYFYKLFLLFYLCEAGLAGAGHCWRSPGGRQGPAGGQGAAGWSPTPPESGQPAPPWRDATFSVHSILAFLYYYFGELQRIQEKDERGGGIMTQTSDRDVIGGPILCKLLGNRVDSADRNLFTTHVFSEIRK